MGLFGLKVGRSDRTYAEVADKLRESEIRYLHVLRREVANLIVGTDPDVMVLAYEKAWTWEQETATNPTLLRADEVALLTKIQMFEDFDLIGTRHFVSYAEGRASLSDDDIVERYLELSRMLVFMRNRLQPDVSRRRPLHDEKEHKILLDRVRKAKDCRFRECIDEAMQRCHNYRQGFAAGKGEPLETREAFSDDEFEVFPLPFGATPENETGIVLKKTNEYGVYAFFFHDDGRRSDTYYRSDRLFSRRDYIGR